MLVGTSGWTYNSWNGPLYPPEVKGTERLGYYAEQFPTVEYNGSYYHWPKDTTMEGYHRRLPAGFKMAVKASRFLTHYRRLADPTQWCERIIKTMDLLGPHAGPLLVQLPSDLERDDERLNRFLGALPERIVVAVEFQHPSWLDEGVFDLLHRHGAGFVISVIAGQQPILRAVGRLVYVRFHNFDPSMRYGGSFDDASLTWWAGRLRELTADGLPAFAYFNNDMNGYAVANARTLTSLLRAGVHP